MKRKPTSIFLLSALAALMLTAAFSADADAGPVWKFGGTALTGAETISGSSSASGFTIPGLTTKCELTYKMTIFNSGGTGHGELTHLLFTNCSTTSEACEVDAIAADNLPWLVHLVTVGPGNYVVLDGVRIGILYGGFECVLDGVVATVTGSAGGLFSNGSSTITFNSSTLSATGTELRALGSKVEWKSTLATGATGAHNGQALEVG